VENTATGNAVHHNSGLGAVTISGGTVSAASGYAVLNASTNADAGLITLLGNPAITGRIRPAAAGKLAVTGTPTFAPSAGAALKKGCFQK